MRPYIRISEEDQDNAIRNMVTIFGGGGASYNAVISVTFSNEGLIEPVTLQEAKDWARIDVADDDALITRLIKAARRICETYVCLSFITREVSAVIHNGLGNFTLPYGPVVGEVLSFADADANVLADYDLRTPYGSDIVVTYNAGYPEGELREDLRSALLCQIAWMYQNRGDEKLASGLSLETMLILKPLRYT